MHSRRHVRDGASRTSANGPGQNRVASRPLSPVNRPAQLFDLLPRVAAISGSAKRPAAPLTSNTRCTAARDVGSAANP